MEKVVDIPDAYRDDRFDASFDARLGFRTRDIYCMPVRNRAGSIVGVLQLLNRSRELSDDDRGFLSDISVHIGLAIENASRHLQILEEKRVEQQLELAREIILVKSARKQRLLWGVLRLRCPICLGGRVFTGPVGTRRRCEDCGYSFSREGRSFWGSTFLTWTATIAIAFAAGFVLTYGVDPPSDALSLTIIGVVELVLLMMFFRYWKTAWIAIDLYKRPPTEKDFDESKGFLPSKDTPGVD